MLKMKYLIVMIYIFYISPRGRIFVGFFNEIVCLIVCFILYLGRLRAYVLEALKTMNIYPPRRIKITIVHTQLNSWYGYKILRLFFQYL